MAYGGGGSWDRTATEQTCAPGILLDIDHGVGLDGGAECVDRVVNYRHGLKIGFARRLSRAS